MTAPTETNDVIEGMCELWITEFSYRRDMVDIRFVTDLLPSDTTVLARVVVSFQGFPSYFSPTTIVRVFSVFTLVRQPVTETVLTTKPNWLSIRRRLENG